ncbi:hypothetical protein J502_2961 [Acinetobacter sp. 1294596]|uniref:virulence factor TspB C-terminal domain-related protein n=1 Tax=Acinetobacter sp. 1294596 TaxID=1310603 RepID=UPI000453625C|nr:virulence factor TspB C-terminal domain-related protein [Acinetobacter sp. 1294596]EXF55954.1 hypothetical protein J502_2961 [Acinetobacter sp. 1294596]
MKNFRYLFGFFILFFSQYIHAAYMCGSGAQVVLTTNLSDYPSSICADVGGNNCLVTERESIKNSDGTWTVFAISTGDTCSSLTPLKKPTSPTPPDDNCIRDNGSIICPDDPDEPEKPTVLKCTADSCLNPDNLRCPIGYVSGSFNGQSLCMKSNKQPDEEPDDELDVSDETRAINKAKNSIVGAINSLSESFSSGLNTIYQLLSEKLTGNSGDGETDSNNNSGGGTGNSETGDVDTSGLHADLPILEVPASTKQLDENIFNVNAQCPADNTLSMNIAGRHYTHTFSYAKVCEGLAIIGYFILIMCYLYASHIVIRA